MELHGNRQQQHPKEVGKPFNRDGSRLGDQTVPFGQVARVGEGDSRVIDDPGTEKRDVNDENRGSDEGRQQNGAAGSNGDFLGIDRMNTKRSILVFQYGNAKYIGLDLQKSAVVCNRRLDGGTMKDAAVHVAERVTRLNPSGSPNPRLDSLLKIR